MKIWIPSACLLVILTAAACSDAPPAQPQPQPQPAAAPTAAPATEDAPKSEAIARADALLEDLKRRQEAQEKAERPAQDEGLWRDKVMALQLALNDEQLKLATSEHLRTGDSVAQAAYKKQQEAVESARLAIEKLREEARRAGVPPGWLR